MTCLRDSFLEYFQVKTGNAPEVLDESLKLRYQVYCLEQAFEDAARFPDRLERDEYDTRSAHSIVHHHHTGLTAASVRLVLPDPENFYNLFPIEEHCATSLTQARTQVEALPRGTLGEISRFAISKEFKRRVGEKGTVDGIGPDLKAYPQPGPTGRRVIPHLILGLFLAIVQMSKEHGITHWYAVMDRSLLRLLAKFGIHFNTLGDPVNYHGVRQPCFGPVDEVLAGIWRTNFEVWQLITDDGVLWPAPATGEQIARPEQ